MSHKNILERYAQKIQEELKSNDASLISLKILYPSDSKQSKLKPLLILNSVIDRNIYDTLVENVFVGTDAERTLSFLKYREYLRTKDFKEKKDENKYNTTFNYFTNDAEFKINNELRKKFSDPAKLDQYWSDWITAVRNFPYGLMTLWTYVVLPRIINNKEEQFIASAFLIFSNKIKNKSSVLINKFTQDLLIECISYHFYIELLLHSTRAAISQVMARNMSHNIGSHVLSKYKSLDDLKDTNSIEKLQFIPLSDIDK